MCDTHFFNSRQLSNFTVKSVFNALFRTQYSVQGSDFKKGKNSHFLFFPWERIEDADVRSLQTGAGETLTARCYKCTQMFCWLKQHLSRFPKPWQQVKSKFCCQSMHCCAFRCYKTKVRTQWVPVKAMKRRRKLMLKETVPEDPSLLSTKPTLDLIDSLGVCFGNVFQCQNRKYTPPTSISHMHCR